MRDGREERAEDKDFRGGIGVLVTGDVLLDPASFRKLAVAIAAAAVVLLAFWAIGRRRRG